MATIFNWNNQEISIATSKGGKISVCNYEENLIIPKGVLWPHPDIIKKLYISNQSKAFDQSALNVLSAKLGFYCDLQSLRSEDAITWSVFGTLNYFPKKVQVLFVNSLLEVIKEEPVVKDCLIQLWTRIAHPDTLVSGGPEIDFQIIGDTVVILGECKWNAKIAENQGKEKNKNQLQLRQEFLEKYGKTIFPKASKRIILTISLARLPTEIGLNITWDEICSKTNHPLSNEITKYYYWKKGF